MLAGKSILLEAEKRRNKSLQSKTTMSGLPPLTHKPLGQVQGPKGPIHGPKQSQAQKWCEPDVQIWSRSASRMVIRMPLISATVELLVHFSKFCIQLESRLARLGGVF